MVNKRFLKPLVIRLDTSILPFGGIKMAGKTNSMDVDSDGYSLSGINRDDWIRMDKDVIT